MADRRKTEKQVAAMSAEELEAYGYELHDEEADLHEYRRLVARTMREKLDAERVADRFGGMGDAEKAALARYLADNPPQDVTVTVGVPKVGARSEKAEG